MKRTLLLATLLFLASMITVFLKFQSQRLSYALAEKEAKYRTLMDDMRLLQTGVIREKTPARLMARARELQLDLVLFTEPAPQQIPGGSVAARGQNRNRISNVTERPNRRAGH